MKLTIISLLSLFFLLNFSCSEDQFKKTASAQSSSISQDSELTLLMREMFDESLKMKKRIEKGKLPKKVKDFELILTAKATEAKKTESESYKVFAEEYLKSLEALRNANLGEAKEIFNGMVQSCMNCHVGICPGPMVKIKKLYVEL